MDFARLELLKLFAEHEHYRVHVASDFRDTDRIASANGIVTYTCEVLPEPEQREALAGFLNGGGRWFALHGTNSKLRYVKGRGWEAQGGAEDYTEMLGSQFVAHPPIQPFTVKRSCDHPLVKGIEPFEADDELYLCRFFGDHELLLETEFSGTAEGFVESDWTDNRKVPVMYLRPWGEGEVLYLNLGHARGRYDMQPIMDEYPHVERGSWKQPAFYELLRRGIRWCVGEA